MIRIKEFLMALWIILIPFQDTGLQNLPIGFLGTSPSFIPLSLLIFIHFLEWVLGEQSLKVNKTVLFIVGYVLTVSAVYLMISGLQSHGTNLALKTMNLSVLTFLFIYPAFFINYRDFPRIALYVKIAFFTTVLGVVLNDLFPADFVTRAGLIHARELTNWRPCGFTGEASYLSAMTISLGFLSAHFSRRTAMRMIVLVLTILVTFYSSSKGGWISILLVVPAVALIRTKMHWGLRAVLLIITIIVGNYVVEELQAKFVGDIESTFSTATRSVLILTSIIIVVHNPFGVGFAGFLPAVDKYVPQAVTYLDRHFSTPLNFAEVLSYVGADTDRAISTKTFLGDNLVFFGVPFLIAYVVFHYRLFSRLAGSRHVYLLAGALFCMLAISTYIPALGMYSIPLVYGVALNEIRR
jgi:hypothetical protein